MTLLLDDEDCEMMSPPIKAPRTQEPTDAPVFHRKGGNGLEKMSSLAYGTPVVRVADGDTNAAKRPRGVPSSVSPRATANGSHTPQNLTQPKVLTAASPAAAIPTTPSPHAAGVASTATPNRLHSESTVVSTDPSTSVTTAHSQPDVVSRALVLEDGTDKNTKAKAVTPAAKPQQMKLSDFFSKMACKRPASP